MEDSLIRLISVSVSIFVLVLGITMFFGLFGEFFGVESSASDFYFNEEESLEPSYYSKADIYYTYEEYADDEGIDGFSGDYVSEVDLWIDAKAIDFTTSRDEVIGEIFALSSDSFEKLCVYDKDELIRVEYTSR